MIMVRKDAVARARVARGLESNTALAAQMGIHRTQIGRILSGQQRPGEQFIACLCVALEMSMNDLFVVVEADEARAA